MMEAERKVQELADRRRSTGRGGSVVAIYAVVALFWIFASDRVVGSFASDLQSATLYSMLKGTAFVAVTSLLLLVLIRRLLVRLEAADLRARQAEEKRLEAEVLLERERRLDGLGRIATGVASDLGNLLEPLRDLLERMHGSGRIPEHRDLEVIRSAVGRGAELVQGMLQLGGGTLPASNALPGGGEDPAALDDGGGMDVLVVEDESAIRMFVREWLEASGFRVATAASASELRLLVRSGKAGPRAVVLDWFIGDDRPDAVIELIRNWVPDTRCVAMSGQILSPEELDRAGAERFLLKPFAGRDLIDALEAEGIRPAQLRSGFQRGFLEDMSTL